MANHEGTATTRINEDIEALKDDLRRLRTDLAGLPGRARLYSRSQAMRGRERLREAATALQEKARQRAHDTSGVLKQHGHDAVDNWRGKVEHRPLASMAIAFAAGVLLTAVLEHRYH